MPHDTSAPQEIDSPAPATPIPETEAPESGTEAAQIDDRQRIARRAYERYLSRGGDPGRDQDDWLEAERELIDPND